MHYGCVCATPWRPSYIKDDVTIRSWTAPGPTGPGSVTPETPEDIVEIVKSVVRFPSPVRPAGSMHSTARMNGDDGGTMVDMKAMNRILKFGEDSLTVEVVLTYIVVSNALKEAVVSGFHVTTEIGNVTLGAMATAATKDSTLPGRLWANQLLCERHAFRHAER